ncbi:extracellular solute-binding protein [Aeromonas veronii]
MKNKIKWIGALFVLVNGSWVWAASLPADLKWETNDTDPVFASPKALPGGSLNMFVESFPLTFRTVGPDSNGSFRSFILDNQLRLISFHPNTGNPIPSLATHWAIAPDNQTVYFKLDPRAKWSDGKPVNADDYTFGYEMMRSKHIKGPWFNNYYTTEVVAVEKIDDHTIMVKAGNRKAKMDLLNTTELWPQPKHYYKLTPNWVKQYNWAVVPTTGPYVISNVKKGKSVTFSKQKDWWAKDDRYNQHRFNIDTIKVQVIRDHNIAFRHFLKGEIDTFEMILPNWWHEKAVTPEYKKGYVQKVMAMTDTKQGGQGVHLNVANPKLADVNVRLGIQHAFNIDKMIETVLRGGYDKPGPDGILQNEKGERLTLALTYTSQEHSKRLTVLKEEAKKAGLDLELNLVDGATGFKVMLEKKHEAAWLGWGGGGLYPQYWEFFHSANANKPQTNNLFNVADKELDALIDAYNVEFDMAKRAKLSQQIQQRIYDLAIFVPGVQLNYVRASSWRYVMLPEVPATKNTPDLLYWPMDGYPHSSGGLLWLDPKVKEETRNAKEAGEALAPINLLDKTYARH